MSPTFLPAASLPAQSPSQSSLPTYSPPVSSSPSQPQAPPRLSCCPSRPGHYAHGVPPGGQAVSRFPHPRWCLLSIFPAGPGENRAKLTTTMWRQGTTREGRTCSYEVNSCWWQAGWISLTALPSSSSCSLLFFIHRGSNTRQMPRNKQKSHHQELGEKVAAHAC